MELVGAASLHLVPALSSTDFCDAEVILARDFQAVMSQVQFLSDTQLRSSREADCDRANPKDAVQEGTRVAARTTAAGRCMRIGESLGGRQHA